MAIEPRWRWVNGRTHPATQPILIHLINGCYGTIEPVHGGSRQTDPISHVQSRARGETGRIRLGFAGATYFQPIVPGIVRAFRERFPAWFCRRSNTTRHASSPV